MCPGQNALIFIAAVAGVMIAIKFIVRLTKPEWSIGSCRIMTAIAVSLMALLIVLSIACSVKGAELDASHPPGWWLPQKGNDENKVKVVHDHQVKVVHDRQVKVVHDRPIIIKRTIKKVIVVKHKSHYHHVRRKGHRRCLWWFPWCT